MNIKFINYQDFPLFIMFKIIFFNFIQIFISIFVFNYLLFKKKNQLLLFILLFLIEIIGSA